jgi:molybdopterin-containing oxidoreductase family membrane subunit
MFAPTGEVNMATMTMQTRSYNRTLLIWLASLALVLAVGLVAMFTVLLKGLQVTGLSDRVPWGLWITLDLSSIALGAGAFTFSAAVYLFRIKRLEILTRPAVFIGFLGYSSAMLALAMDIGRPDRFWHPMVYWNVHSVLWEVTWCVILYSTVLVMEVLAVVGDSRFGERWPPLRQLGHISHKLTPILALIGMGLSLLHQSSLGATYGVLSGRAIWFKPSLPVMFIISAVAGGMSLTMLATMTVARLRGQQFLPPTVCAGVTRTIGFITLGYLYIKLWDWATTSYYSNVPATANILSRLHATTPYTATFWGVEVILSGLIPAIILLLPNLCQRKNLVMLALGLIVAGVVINRWNVTLSGLVAPPDWSPGVLGNIVAVSYFPSLVEIGVAMGIVAYALLGFTLGVRFLELYPRPGKPESAKLHQAEVVQSS